MNARAAVANDASTRRQRIRPSQLITTFGPGALVDLPDDSVMIAGIEHWFDGYKRYRTLCEPRLQASLKIAELRTPPVGSPGQNDVPFVRFPRWRVCPSCNRLSEQFRWPTGRPDLPPVPRCNSCDRATYPARIVIACSKGHIDDFPWFRWAHRGRHCTGGGLSLSGVGRSAALGDIQVVCTCGAKWPLSGALGQDAMAGIGVACTGRRPWLDDATEPCDERPFALQRGASNVYFSVVRSALSIPPWSDPLQAEVSTLWSKFRTPLPRENWEAVITASFPGHDRARVIECVERFLGLREQRLSIRREEYEVLDRGADTRTLHFEARREEVVPRLARFLSRLVAVPRLREVRALIGFTRIQAPEMDPTMEVFQEERGVTVSPAPLANVPQEWLPAVENLGEGIFLRLETERLKHWEALEAVSFRSRSLLSAYSAWRQGRGLPELKGASPRLVLLHTLAHLLVRQMSLDSGYSSASLRERIYADTEMAGLIVYTSTPDSDGSLGGLVRQTRPPERFEEVVLSAVTLARLCSNDPLCREHDPRHTERLNAAACHACAMVSETSCEFGNRLLDRAMVVSLPSLPPTGFFDFDE